MHQLKIAFVDDNYFVSEREKTVEKITKILKIHTQFHKATVGRVQFDKTLFLVGNGREKMVSLK